MDDEYSDETYAAWQWLEKGLRDRERDWIRFPKPSPMQLALLGGRSSLSYASQADLMNRQYNSLSGQSRYPYYTGSFAGLLGSYVGL